MLKAYKHRLYPTQAQKEYLANCFGCVRFIYNQMLSDKIDHYKKTKQMLKNIPAQYKEEFPFLKEVDSLALANAQQNLNKAYKNFFRDKSVGFPQFKSKYKSKASYTTNNQGGNIRIEDRNIKLPKIGFVKPNQHREFEGDIKSCTISMNKSGKYFVSILTEKADETLELVERKIGIYLGSHPGVASLKKRQYYGNPGNAFWRTVFSASGTVDPVVYEKRLETLLSHGSGLRDVYDTVEREGSRDVNIKNETPKQKWCQ